MRRRLRKSLAIILPTCVALASCGFRPDGWGVLLWSHDEQAFPTGSVVPIVETSMLNTTYNIQSDKHAPIFTIDQWRLAFLKRKAQAEEYGARFNAFRDLFAVSDLAGLPVRESRDPDAKRVYKLRIGEIVKVLEKDDTQSTAGEYEGYWYRVLTDGGVIGYTFNRYLQIYTSQELAEREQSVDKDENLDQFLNANYRPKYYRDMLVRRRINLERFLPEYGLYPDPENGRLVIVAEEHTSIIEYESISRVSEDAYAFEGSTLLMVVKSRNEVNLQYSEEGVQYSEDYVFINADVDILIIHERERRFDLFDQLFSLGNTLNSTAYGTIILAEDGGFHWEGIDRLVPGIVSAAAGNIGIVDYPLHLSPELKGVYDGVVSFVFAEAETVHFLYRFERDGIRLKHLVWVDDFEDIMVEQEGLSPIIIFFRVSTEDSRVD